MKVQREAKSLLLLGGSMGNFFSSLLPTNQGGAGDHQEIGSTKELQGNQNPPDQESLGAQTWQYFGQSGSNERNPRHKQGENTFLPSWEKEETALGEEDSDHPKTTRGGTTRKG